MTTACGVCLESVEGASDGTAIVHHPRRLRALFGVARVPRVELVVAKLHTAAPATAGRVALPGVQRKLSVGLDAKKSTLDVEREGARFLLKPESPTFPGLPANEHVVTRLAAAFDVVVPQSGLVALAAGTPAYVAARFDRPPKGGKPLVEDFCRLNEKPAKEKYEGSARLCAKTVRRFADEPGIEALRLFRRFVFAWWVGDGDLHLKNLSLLTDADGRRRLTPAYDLCSTRLHIPDDRLALPVVGKRDSLTRAVWLEAARRFGLPEKAAARVLDAPDALLEAAVATVERSYLGAEARRDLSALLRARAATIRS